MRIAVFTVALALVGCLAGCNEQAAAPAVQTGPKPVFLAVDFHQGQVLRYKFVSSRNIEINWDPSKPASSSANAMSKATESLEMVVAYDPIEVNEYGLSKIKGTFESISVRRTSSTRASTGGRDAVETLKGKSFVFTIDPAGRIADNNDLDNLIKLAGKNAFRPSTDPRKAKIKEPEMISDLIATQWFVWDAISSIPHPSKGLMLHDKWTSKTLVPTPMVSRKARDVTYTLAAIQNGPQGPVAEIDGTYKMADSAPHSWPVPYVGSFQMAGMFGFLRGYKYESLEGSGKQMFDIDTGVLRNHTQKFTLKAEASMLIPLGPNPQVTINQTITMNRMGS